MRESGGRTNRSEIQEIITCIWNKKELPEEWMRSIILPVFTKVDKTGFSNYKGISRLSVTYKIEFNNLLSRVTQNVMVISGDHQCGFRRNKSTTDDIFCIVKYLRKIGIKWGSASAI